MKNNDAVAKGLFSVYNREVEKGEAQQVSPHKKSSSGGEPAGIDGRA